MLLLDERVEMATASFEASCSRTLYALLFYILTQNFLSSFFFNPAYHGVFKYIFVIWELALQIGACFGDTRPGRS